MPPPTQRTNNPQQEFTHKGIELGKVPTRYLRVFYEGLYLARFGSKADILRYNRRVRFTPESGHSAVRIVYPL